MDDEYRDHVPELPIKPNRRQQGRSSSSSEGLAPSTRASSVGIAVPTQEEINFYFEGLGGSPILVARSSTEPYPPPMPINYNPRTAPEFSSRSPRKMLFNIGHHPIVQQYDQGPRGQILSVLQGLPWYRIDVLRIGYNYAAIENPIVVLITVQPGGVEYLKGQETVGKCHQILLDYNLDVHVEMMEGENTCFPAGLGGSMLPIVPYQRNPHIGQSLGPQGTEEQSSGTLGLFLSIYSKDSAPRRCALTCSHVAFPSGVRNPPDGLDRAFNYLSNPVTFLMDQPSVADHDARLEHFKDIRIDYNDDLKDMIEKGEQAQQGLRKPLSQKQLEKIEWFKNRIEEIDKNTDDAKNFSRSFGKVFSCSGITIDPNHNNTVDWALISLDEDRFRNIPCNTLPPFDFSAHQLHFIVNKILPTKHHFTPFSVESHITEFVSHQEILANTITDTNGFKTFRVLKHGRSTGWTAGVSNEIQSNIQRETDRITREWCIVDLPDGMNFGKKGDSGAAVVDYSGRLVGFLHGAAPSGSHGGMGVTYITPIEWVFENIEATLGVKVALD